MGTLSIVHIELFLWLCVLCFAVIQSLIALVNDPQPEHPLRADLAEEYSKDRKKFLKNAEEFTKKHGEKRPMDWWPDERVSLSLSLSPPLSYLTCPALPHTSPPPSLTLLPLSPHTGPPCSPGAAQLKPGSGSLSLPPHPGLSVDQTASSSSSSYSFPPPRP